MKTLLGLTLFLLAGCAGMPGVPVSYQDIRGAQYGRHFETPAEQQRALDRENFWKTHHVNYATDTLQDKINRLEIEGWGYQTEAIMDRDLALQGICP